jgi:hypothetical protein
MSFDARPICEPAFAQSFDPDTGTGNVLTFAHAHRLLLPKTRELQAAGADCILSPWFRDPARLSIRKVHKPRAVAASAIMKCFVTSKPTNKAGRAWASLA